MNNDNACFYGAREAALRALVRVEQDRAFLNLVMPVLFENLSDDDRSLAVQIAKGTLQRLNTIDWVLNLFSRQPLASYTPWIRNILRSGAYQLLYLDRIPNYAVVDEAVKLGLRFGHRGVAGLVNAVLRRLTGQIETLPWPDRKAKLLEYLSLYYSFPHWLVSRALKRFGDTEAELWLQSNNEIPPLSIRPNSLRISSEELIFRLKVERITAQVSPILPYMVRMSNSYPPADTKTFQEGLFTVQGESSALVAPLLQVIPGDTVVDFCSAPGGKSTHLAELMNNSGLIYAVDLHRNRLQLVKKAAHRLGIDIIETVNMDSRLLNRREISLPDAVLVDAPCSGLGVLRRLPEIKWRRTEKELESFKKLQLELLDAAADLLEPGGMLFYSVCSTEYEETVEVVEKFNRHYYRQFTPEPLKLKLPDQLQEDQPDINTVSLWPHHHHVDGFFMACWRKKM